MATLGRLVRYTPFSRSSRSFWIRSPKSRERREKVTSKLGKGHIPDAVGVPE